MFKRVGKEIKTWAKVLVVLEMIPVVMAGVAIAILAAMYDEELLILGIIGAIVVILLGYFIVRIANIMLYAKGELVDRVMRIDEKLERMEKMQHPAPPAPPAPPVSSPYAPPAPPVPAPAPAPAPVPAAPVPSAPVVNTPVQAAPVAKAPVQSAPVVAAPIVSAPVNEDPGQEDYTVAAVSRPVPKPVYTAPVKNVPAEWTCPNCGQRNSADGNWCRNCGTKKNV